MSNVVTVQNLYKSFGKNHVLQNLSFTIESGRVIGLLGENGAGKSTLIKILADLYKADKGRVLINGKPVSSHTHDDVSFMLESSNLYYWMTVRQAIDYYSDMFNNFKKEKALALCKELNIDLKSYIANLSKGNQERVLLMLTLSREVPLYLLDEPVGGLDPGIKRSIIQIILGNIPENATVLIASHLLRDLEEIFDEIYIFHDNRLVTAIADDIREKYHSSVEEYYLEVTHND
jgi:ABC-2 type transport system ATP-binding protein